MSKADRALAEAERLASVIAAAPAESSDPFAPPAMLLDERLKPALTVWRELAAELKQFNIVSNLDRYTFAVLCISVADYMAAVDNILVNGPQYWAKTHGGNKMLRTNPAVMVKERLGKFIFDAAAEFGLSPLRRYALLREQSAYGGGSMSAGVAHSADAPALTCADDEDLIGLAARRNSPPPTLQ
ncbi:MAG: P27 family phage terminase small subunit [Methylocystis sp.]|uniref:P27 family phage terminase small subunit n=1 Tax=Methylocystis sp. TaxID=1911079 RepID=UPI003DA329C4